MVDGLQQRSRQNQLRRKGSENGAEVMVRVGANRVEDDRDRSVMMVGLRIGPTVVEVVDPPTVKVGH